MKSAPYDNKLDGFISDILKTSDENFQPFDWSEVEVLLKHEQRSIPLDININRKHILISAAAAGVVILFFIVFKIASNYSSTSATPETTIDSTQNTFNLVDTPNTAVKSAMQADTAKIDSLPIGLIPAADSGKGAVPAAEKQTNSKEILPAVKKKKKDTTQSVTSDPIQSEPGSIVLDTSTVFAPKEDIIANPVVPDTAGKKSTGEPQPKKKKSKPRKDALPAEAKPDSLNQQ